MTTRMLLAVTRTGGHTVPALAVAEVIRRRYPQIEIRFAGTAEGIEVRMVPRSGFTLETIPVIGLRRSLHVDLIRFPWMLLKGLVHSFKLISNYAPDLVFCTGGYVSGPVGLSARVLGVPLVLHEQNDYPGVTIRTLSRLATQVFLAFQGAARRIGGCRRVVVGNPTRGGWTDLDPADARRSFGLDTDRHTLVVVGGSQGARGINGAVQSALPRLMEKGLQVLWQTGKLDYDAALATASRWSGRVIVKEFIDDMNAAYRSADLALTRSGAMTLAEITLLGVPAVLVPLPTAAEGHQEHNARAMERAGAARMIRQPELDGDTLSATVCGLVEDPDRLARMASCSRALARPEAADRIVDELVSAGLLKQTADGNGAAGTAATQS